VTLGDPRGIGPEVTARALADPLDAEVTVIGPDDLTAGVPAADRVGVGAWEVTGETGPLSSHEQAIRAGTLAGRAVERAAALALSGEVHAICTAPIDKWALRLAGFAWPGHTEMLGHLAGGAEPAMMLAAEPLRVVLLTVHVALRDVPALLTVDRVVRIGEIARKGLREWFGIASPRLAVCALNPHAGERGLFGDEEARVLEPAARRLEAAGPLSADTVFVRALRGEFDAVLAPYHDVGMTAVKVAAFGRGVNVTLGLPFPRTSPDHGTAIDLAGRGLADPSSMRQALEMAVRLARRR
jgi:4-hydroxythreonine-4-phosphate dehydrogenase